MSPSPGVAPKCRTESGGKRVYSVHSRKAKSLRTVAGVQGRRDNQEPTTMTPLSAKSTLEQIRQRFDAAAKPLAVQDRVQTEWGALGVVCALLPALLGQYVLSVAGEGERFDYRIGNEAGECGLEVSGTLSESAEELRERHRQKIRQLRENPDHLDGYVIVIGFTLREVLISYHLPLSEENP